MRTPLRVLVTVTVPLFALGGAGSGLASSTQLVAPGDLDAGTLPVVAGGCWTGTVTFTPTQATGNPKTYRRVTIAGAPGAFTACVGQYADLSVDAGGTQFDLVLNQQLGAGDSSGFGLRLSRGMLPSPAPAGTFYTLVIHP